MNRQWQTRNKSVIDISPEHLLELERFAEIGRLSASLLHEINNPLTAAMLWLEQCGNQGSPHLGHVRSSICLLQRYVEAARQQIRFESQHRHFSMEPELEQVRQVLAPIARRRDVILWFSPVHSYKLYGDPVKFQQIIANLVQNAIDAYDDWPENKPKLVRLDVQNNGDFVVVKVNDWGRGIAEDQIPLLFRPFYTTKHDVGLGLGIGLSAVKRYIETDFRGSIRVSSCRRHGTRFIAHLHQGSANP